MYHGQASAVVVCSPGVAASEHTGGAREGGERGCTHHAVCSRLCKLSVLLGGGLHELKGLPLVRAPPRIAHHQCLGAHLGQAACKHVQLAPPRRPARSGPSLYPPADRQSAT